MLKYKNFCSNYFDVTLGVPQGSHIAPLSFNLFIITALSFLIRVCYCLPMTLNYFALLKLPMNAILI